MRKARVDNSRFFYAINYNIVAKIEHVAKMAQKL